MKAKQVLFQYAEERVVKRTKLPANYWKHLPNQRDALSRVGKELGVKTLDDWYKVSPQQVKQQLSFLYNYYDNSLFTALKTLYPEHDWDPLSISTKVPKRYWVDKVHQKDALDKIASELNITCTEDWYSVPQKKVKERLSFIKNYYNNSLSKALQTLYPQYAWNPTEFTKASQGHWSDQSNQKIALERVGRELGVEKLDDWYNIPSSRVQQMLPFVSKHYNSSLYTTLQTLYPEHSWDPLRFMKVPQGYWSQPTTPSEASKLMEALVKEYNIKDLYDWHHIPNRERRVYLRIANKLYGNITNMFNALFRSTKWADDISSSFQERNLRELFRSVTSAETHTVIHGHSVDVYLPEYSIAIEFQGQHHFSQHAHGSFKEQSKRDFTKRRDLKAQGIQLIEIPYWWKGTWSQLQATLCKL